MLVEVCLVQYLRHTYTKQSLIIFLKFKFNWTLCQAVWQPEQGSSPLALVSRTLSEMIKIQTLFSKFPA